MVRQDKINNNNNEGEHVKLTNLFWNPKGKDIQIDDDRFCKGNSDTWSDTDFNSCSVKYEVEVSASDNNIETVANIIEIDLRYEVENIDTEATEIVEIKIERFEDYQINIEFDDSASSHIGNFEDGMSTNIYFDSINIDTENKVVTIWALN